MFTVGITCKYYYHGSGTRVKWITLREDTEEIL